MEHILLVTEMVSKFNKLFSNFKVSRPTCLSSLLKLYVAFSILSNLPLYLVRYYRVPYLPPHPTPLSHPRDNLSVPFVYIYLYI